MLQGQARRRQGQSDEALRLLNQSVALARQALATDPNPVLLLDIKYRAYSWLVSIALSYDDYQTARAHSVYLLALCQQAQMLRGEIMALTCLIDTDKALGAYARAQQYAEQALAAARKANFLWGQAICHIQDVAARRHCRGAVRGIGRGLPGQDRRGAVDDRLLRDLRNADQQ